ncbi:MAG: Protease synthase and sporulation protein PAI 2 [Fimbriimonadaceae bacterium]|nr:Protease synthase and sporulation protein PAI 2 [Fimbriimonadaceae bacterium]
MPEFREQSLDAIRAFIRRHPFAMVVAAGKSGVVATHVPLLIDGEGDAFRFRGHVMRKTPYWEGFHTAGEVLVAFTGPDAPVRESWMERRPFGGTWNYMAVHARGTLRFLPEPELAEILRELKDSNEVDSAATFERLPPDYVPSLIRAIEGFEIAVTSIEAVFKLSQNRSRAEFDRTIDELRKQGGESGLVAEEMSARRSEYFPE